MLIGGVIGDEIDDDLQVVAVRIINQLPRVSQGAEQRLDADVAADVITTVLHRRRVPRSDQDPVYAQIPQIRHAGPQSGYVPDAVPVAVGEATQVDLVHDRAAPPRHR
jgi:hypothetical protein